VRPQPPTSRFLTRQRHCPKSVGEMKAEGKESIEMNKADRRNKDRSLLLEIGGMRLSDLRVEAICYFGIPYGTAKSMKAKELKALLTEMLEARVRRAR
jgi:hypothetical protein